MLGPIVFRDASPRFAPLEFPRTIALIVAPRVGDPRGLMVHYWIPSQEWADRMADGEWR